MSAGDMQKLMPIAKLVGLSSASALSAYIASFSLSIPAIELAPPDLMVKQWSNMFNRGANTAPPLAIACSSCFAFFAYSSRDLPGRFPIPSCMLYMSAAALAPCIVPFTWTVMWDGVQKLETRAKAEGSEKQMDDVELKRLVRTWAAQNYGRSLIVASSAVLGGVAMLA